MQEVAKIRLVALDLDGTAFNDEKVITSRTLIAMRAALDAGVVVVPATGRPASGVPEAFLELPGVRYAITSNGAAVIDLAEQKPLFQLLFAPQTVLPIYDTLEPFGGMLSVFVNGQSYMDKAHLDANIQIVPANLRSYFYERGLVPDLRAFLAEHAAEVEKFSVVYKDVPTQKAAWDAATTHHRVEATTSLPRNMELNAPGVDKGRALLGLAERLGIAPEQTLACGDSGNDLAMLRCAGIGVAMGNATPEVKEQADCITTDNNHDGVGAAIEKYVLGPEPPRSPSNNEHKGRYAL